MIFKSQRNWVFAQRVSKMTKKKRQKQTNKQTNTTVGLPQRIIFGKCCCNLAEFNRTLSCNNTDKYRTYLL